MDLQLLRDATRSDHDATEALLPMTGQDLTVPRYVDALGRLYRILNGWDAWAAKHVPADLQPLLATRHRSPLLAADLNAMGADAGALPALRFDLQLPDGSDARRAAFLGAMYVIEGSTLGGQYIARHVEEHLHLVAGVGNTYFRGYGEATGSQWNAFKQVLAAVPDSKTVQVIDGACACFGIFHAALAEGR